MRLSQGTFYVIAEHDRLRGVASDYYKLGRVGRRESGSDGERTTRERAGEHQTGNPRELVIVAEIPSPAVSDLETMMHGVFSPRRVLGEWFILREEDLDLAIRTAEHFAAEQMRNRRVALISEEAGHLESEGEKIQPDSEMIGWWERWDEAQSAAAVIARSVKQIEDLLKSLVTRNIRIDPIAAWSSQVSAPLDADRLQSTHPEIFSAFLTREERTRGSCRLRRSGSAFDSISVDGSLRQVLDRVDPVLSMVRTNPDAVEHAHELHLWLQQFRRKYQWQRDHAELNLRALCGTAPGIEGVLTWNRIREVKEGLDIKSLKKAYPDLSDEFRVVRRIARFVVSPGRNYPFIIPDGGSDLSVVRSLIGS